MTHYSIQDIESFYDAYLAARGKLDVLTAAYTMTRFRDERARAFARHGFPRRLALMLHCIERTIETFPPRPRWIPDANGILDATVCLQAFVANVFGSIDNLAHIWVAEKGLTAQDGTPLPDSRISLRPENGALLDSLSPVFASYLKKLGPWFEYLETYRRALEHHVPLYVAPHSVPQPRLRQYAKIGDRIPQAERREDHAEADRLTHEQTRPVSFFPITTQAFGENADKMFFHFQMASDFNTVEDIARRLLLEFD